MLSCILTFNSNESFYSDLQSHLDVIFQLVMKKAGIFLKRGFNKNLGFRILEIGAVLEKQHFTLCFCSLISISCEPELSATSSSHFQKFSSCIGSLLPLEFQNSSFG